MLYESSAHTNLVPIHLVHRAYVPILQTSDKAMETFCSDFFFKLDHDKLAYFHTRVGKDIIFCQGMICKEREIWLQRVLPLTITLGGQPHYNQYTVSNKALSSPSQFSQSFMPVGCISLSTNFPGEGS